MLVSLQADSNRETSRK